MSQVDFFYYVQPVGFLITYTDAPLLMALTTHTNDPYTVSKPHDWLMQVSCIKLVLCLVSFVLFLSVYCSAVLGWISVFTFYSFTNSAVGSRCICVRRFWLDVNLWPGCWNGTIIICWWASVICHKYRMMMQQYKIWVWFLFIMRYNVSHLYKTVDRIIVLYILIFKFLYGRLEDYMKHVE